MQKNINVQTPKRQNMKKTPHVNFTKLAKCSNARMCKCQTIQKCQQQEFQKWRNVKMTGFQEMQTYSNYTYKDVEMPKMQTWTNVTNAQAPTYHTYTKCKSNRNAKITTTCKRQKATHVKIRKCRNVDKYRIP